jgi:glycosyltransferase involved in cell wall biosynthesis
MSRITVLTLVDGIGAGGGERLASEVAKRLDSKRFKSILCATRWSRPRRTPARLAAAEELRSAGVQFLGLERTSAGAVWQWRPVLTLVREEPVDILHAHKFGSNLWASILGFLARPPVVIAHEHTWSYEGRPFRRLSDRYVIAPRVDAFVAVSREDRRRMIEIEGINPQKVRFIPNGIPEVARERGGDVRAELGIASEDPVIGSLGALRAQKAYEVLVRAAALLRPRFPTLRVLIAGGGEDGGRLAALIDELGLGGCVMLLGHRSDVPDVLEALDVAVSSSDFEGSPLSVMEYMDAGKPVVATRVGGVPDLIEDGVHGFLVEPRDPAALAAATEPLLRDPARAAQMGARGRERRRSEFDISVTVSRIEALYEELWAKARG